MFSIFVFFLNITTFEAAEYSCKFKDELNYRLNKTFTTCELINVKFNDKTQFELQIGFNKTQNASFASDVDYDDEDDTEEALRDSIKRVSFKWSKLSNIPNEIFIKFTELEIFDASNTQLSYFNSLSFNKAENLIEIHLQNNNLKTINGFVFVHCKKLEILDISSNQIEKVQLDAFNGLESLQSLDLSGNKIEDLDDETFEPLKSLKSLWLDRNRLKVISTRLFSDANVNLEKLSANNNKISDVSPFVFDQLDKFRYLFLIGNDCVDKSFINHKISENVAIKMELITCFKNYRKTFPKDEESRNITLALSSIEAKNEICSVNLQVYEDSIKKNEEEIEGLLKKRKN